MNVPRFLEDGTLGIEANYHYRGFPGFSTSHDEDHFQIGYPLPRYYVHRRLSDQLELFCVEASLHSELYNGNLLGEVREPAKPSKVQDKQETALAPNNTSRSESEVPQLKKKRKSNPTKSREENQSSQKDSHSDQLEKANSKAESKRGRPKADKKLESAVRLEVGMFNGLVGKPADFKRDVCKNCKVLRMVFCFGGLPFHKNKLKFQCINCLKNLLGERFLNLFDTNKGWEMNVLPELVQHRPWKSIVDYTESVKNDQTGSSLLVFNYFLEEKKHELQRKLTRMIQTSEWAKLSHDLETTLLCYRFIEESIGLLIRIENLLKLQSLEEKLKVLQPTEKLFLENHIKKEATKVKTFLEETVSSQRKANSTPLKGPQYHNSQKDFYFDEDNSSLGKREPILHDAALFIEPEEQEAGTLPLNPFAFEFITSQF